MEEIWTPWRMRFITSHERNAGECVFCTILERDPRHVLARSPHVYVVLNLYPYTPGHVLVIPHRHVARLGELMTEEIDGLTRAIDETERILRRTLGTELIHVGFNLGRAAGAGIEGHLHAHLVPRGVDAPAAEGPDLDALHRRLAPEFAAELRPA
ncbi:MAG: HIT domain-containing protein [Candidatus Eisenbacteria bacterium]